MVDRRDRGHVRADRHEGAVAERDLAGPAGEDDEAEERDRERADVGELRVRHLLLGDHVRRAITSARRSPIADDTRSVASDHALHDNTAEDPGRSDEEDEEEHDEGGGQLELAADEADVGAEERREDAEREAADDRADRALDPAQDRGGERVDQRRLHHRRAEEDDRRDHHPRDRAEHGRETGRRRTSSRPGRRGRLVSGPIAGPHREADARERKNAHSRTTLISVTTSTPTSCRDRDAADVERLR